MQRTEATVKAPDGSSFKVTKGAAHAVLSLIENNSSVITNSVNQKVSCWILQHLCVNGSSLLRSQRAWDSGMHARPASQLLQQHSCRAALGQVASLQNDTIIATFKLCTRHVCSPHHWCAGGRPVNGSAPKPARD